VAALAFWSAAIPDARVLAGDAMFIAASGLGALYVLQVRRWGISAVQGAAIVTVYSALVVVPWYAWQASSTLWRAGAADLLWQVLWQGVMVGAVALIALNYTITRLGPERSTLLVALVPVMAAVLGMVFLGEVPSPLETVAILVISAGVSIGASRAYGGSPAASSAAANRPACGLSRPG
jgi:drug/metabolite transporter (DMT)-like permease